MNNTKVAQGEASVRAIREQLANAATADKGTEYLMGLVQELAKAEAVLQLDTQALHITGWHADRGVEFGEARAMAVAAMTEGVLNGADDTWSGRGNDLRRAEFDAKLRWVRDNTPSARG